MLGDTIRKLRNSKKMTQRELACILHISTSTVGMYERNQRNPDKDILIKIADYFGVSIDYLLGYEPLKQELNQFDKVMNEATSMFTDKEIPEEDKEKLMLALNELFWEAKQNNKKHAKSSNKNNSN